MNVPRFEVAGPAKETRKVWMWYVQNAVGEGKSRANPFKEYDANNGPVCYITSAGRSNALSGFVAANSIYPVIGCPPFSDKADLLVNIHSTLQMPSDTPVLTVIDPQNAAMAAIRILAANDSELRKKVRSHIVTLKKKFNN